MASEDYIELSVRVGLPEGRAEYEISAESEKGDTPQPLSVAFPTGLWPPGRETSTSAKGDRAATHHGFSRALERLDPNDVVLRQDLDALQPVGRELFEALFREKLASLLDVCLDDARKVRIRLHYVGTNGRAEFATLPWELIWKAEKPLPLVVDPAIAGLIRSFAGDASRGLAELTERLCVLVVTSNADPKRPLDLEGEGKGIERAFRESLEPVPAEFVFYEPSSYGDLLKFLESPDNRGRFHVLHFMGHGGFDERGRGGLLFPAAGHPRGKLVTETKLAMLATYGFRLVFLNACESGASSDGRASAFGGLAPTLLAQGIPAVVAMQFPVRDDAAIQFATEVYGGFARGERVDVAVGNGRRDLFAERDDLEWLNPVLFLQRHGELTFEGLERPPPAPPEPDESFRVYLASTGGAESDLLDTLLRDLADGVESQGMALVDGWSRKTDRRRGTEEVQRMVEEAHLCVHLFGSTAGAAGGPNGTTASGSPTPALQDWAIGSRSGTPQLVLVPDDLPDPTDPRLGGLLTDLDRTSRDERRLAFHRMARGQMVEQIDAMRRLITGQDSVRTRGIGRAVDKAYIDFHSADVDEVGQLVSTLERFGVRGRAVFDFTDDDPAGIFGAFEEIFRDFPLYIMVLGKASRQWAELRAKFARGARKSDTRMCVYIAPPTDSADFSEWEFETVSRAANGGRDGLGAFIDEARRTTT